MKIRDGFVSNSSSSSFLLVGIKLNAADKKKVEEAFEAVDYCELKKPFKKLERGDDDKLFGLKDSMSDEDYEVRSFDPDQVAEAKNLLSEFFGRQVEVSIFFGREAC
jgi:hypothetical protein